MSTIDSRAQNIITCDLCSSPVELYCNPCKVNFCAICSPKHMRSKSCKQHTIVLYNERALEPVHPECKPHADQRCEMFCNTCDSPICVKCVTGSHKKHDFIDIKEKILLSMKIIKADTKDLEKSIIPTYENIHAEIRVKASKVHQEHDEVQTNIDQNGVKWHEAIDIIIQKQKQEAEQIKDRNLFTLNKYQTEMQDILSLARDVLKRNKELLKSNDIAQIKNYQSRNNELKTLPRQITWNLPSFTHIRTQADYLNIKFRELNAAIESEIEGIKMKQLTKPDIDVNINVQKDGIYGLIHLPVDAMWINGTENTIDLIDIKGTVMDTVKTVSSEKPQGLSVTKEGHLLFGEPSTGNIVMAKKGHTRTIVTLPRGWAPSEMCFTLSGDLLIVMYRKESFTECKVVRYDDDYNAYQEIQYDDKGAPLYTAGKKPMYIAENKNTDICVSNDNSKNVVTVDQSGRLRWRYTGNLQARKYNSFTPLGIATDSQCHVLVADGPNHCVHGIDKEGLLLCYIDDCGLWYPYAICVDKANRMFVGESAISKRSIKVIRYLK